MNDAYTNMDAATWAAIKDNEIDYFENQLLKQKSMYVYIKSEQYLWTVGFYDPSGKWHPDTDHDNPESAAQRVAFLNGSK